MSESYHYRRIPKPPPEAKAQEKTRGRNTKRNLALVILGLGYALYTRDVPLLIAAVAILLFFLQPLAETTCLGLHWPASFSASSVRSSAIWM